MSHTADGWNFIETCFVLWKCQNCNYHFAIEDGNVSETIEVRCPVCEREHSFHEQTETFEVAIDYYGG